MKIDIPDYLAFPMLGMLGNVIDRERGDLRVLKARRNLNLATKADMVEVAQTRHDTATVLYDTIHAVIEAHPSTHTGSDR